MWMYNLSKEDDSFELIGQRKIVVEYSQRQEKGDNADSYKQNYPSITAIPYAKTEVKGCSISRKTVSTQLA